MLEFNSVIDTHTKTIYVEQHGVIVMRREDGSGEIDYPQEEYVDAIADLEQVIHKLSWVCDILEGTYFFDCPHRIQANVGGKQYFWGDLKKVNLPIVNKIIKSFKEE